MPRCLVAEGRRHPAPPLLAWLILLTSGPLAAATPARFPFPQHQRYVAGSRLPSRSRAELDEDVRAAYRRWKGRYVRAAGFEPDGHARYRIADDLADTAGTVSEGQGYGMWVVALMAGDDPNARSLFDGLWEFALDHPSAIDPRLMDFHVPADESTEQGADDSAFDGDCDIAYALLIADRQWSSSGRIDYLAAARRVIDGLSASAIGPVSRLPLLGDWVDPEGSHYDEYTPRSSDLIVDHFRDFRRVTGDATWDAVVAASQAVVTTVQETVAPTTGLLPDFLLVSPTSGSVTRAPGGFLEGSHDGAYWYNAGRVPWRLGLDALLHGDETSRRQATRIARWAFAAAGGDPRAVRAGYELDGSPIGAEDEWSSFFVAPLGVAAMLAPEQQAWLDAIYDLVRDVQDNYYEDTVSLLCLLAMTGNAWDPTTIDDPASDVAEKIPVRLDASLQNPAWSPSGDRMLVTRFSRRYNEGPSALYLIAPSSGAATLLTEAPDSDSVNMPGTSWSASTDRIVFASDREDAEEIWTISADGTAPRRLTHHGTGEAFVEPTFDPDGGEVVFEARAPGNGEEGTGAIWKIRTDGSGLTRLSPHRTGLDDREPNWSPRGDRIVFQRRTDSSDEWHLFTVAPSGGQERQVTFGPGSDSDPSWSPDGRSIAFSSDRGELPLPSLFVVPETGGDPVRLTFDDERYDGAPSWSPDGRWIAFESYPGEPDGSAGTAIWRVAAPRAECTPGPEVLCLADGRFAVRVSYRTGANATGLGHTVSLTPDTGTFWFFDPGNIEVIVKVLDGCAINNRFWVFAAGLTDVETQLVVQDTTNGAAVSYTNRLGVPFAPVQDTAAFSSCP